MEFFQGRRERYREAGEEEETEEEVGSCSSSQQKTESSSSTDAAAAAAAAAEVAMVEKEHMFDKVVTPSDVGKLNRLVIPKQHAERYFPLDASVNEKGRLLCFEDRTGKPWRFRYSYWNSSQSYVMTKGWSRFVKEKKLDAGDIVSFGRATSAKDRLFIDWKRRPETLTNHLHHHHHSPLMIPSSPMVPWSHYYNYNLGVGNVGPYLYMRSAQQPMMQEGQAAERPVVFESIPVVHGKVAAESTGKRMRLFGVNFDCAASTAPVEDDVQLRLFSGSAVAAEGEEGERKGKASSSFDLDV